MSETSTHRAFNKAIGPLRQRARAAADALALILPDAPLPPALPMLPIARREVEWMHAIRAAADQATIPGTEGSRDTLRQALTEIEALMAESPVHPLLRNEVLALSKAVPSIGGRGGSILQAIAEAVDAGALTASQAAHWRFRLGL
ncbi:MAG: hypothetical protein MUC89_01465 [Acetobacteraceae bacterium]|jgi:hypothetical protein|nr:hypothetical protein [Acetobacteraceae bacterium]